MQTNPETKMAKTVIGGYTVEMDDSNGNMDCFVTKGNYSASLACVLDCGCLENSRGSSIEIDYSQLDKIEEWAMARGY